MSRSWISTLAGAALIAAPLPALADAPAAPRGPLAPGGAAGVKTAQSYTDIPWVFVVGFSLVAVSIALALANNEETTSTTATTGTQ